MKIAFAYDLVHPYTKGGAEKRIWELAELLTSRGHEVHLLTMQFWPGSPLIIRRGVVLHGVCRPKSLHDRRGRRSIRQAVSYAWGLLKALRRQRFDVIDCQATNPLGSLAAWTVARGTGVHFVLTWNEVWGRYWHRYLGVAGWGGRVAELACTALPVRHVAISAHTLRRLIQRVPNAALVVTGVDAAHISSVPADPHPTDVVFCGRLVEHKRVDLLIEGLARLAAEGTPARALIIGDGPERRRLEGLAAARGLAGLVRFTGLVPSSDQVYALMKSSKVFTSPSIREGFGLAVLEAQVCGLPVVTVDHPDNAARELVEDGRTGLLVDSDPIQLALGLRRLLEDDSTRRALGAEAQRRAVRLSWERLTDAVLSIYEARELAAA